MMHPDALDALRRDAVVNAWKLSPGERAALASTALAVATARRRTIHPRLDEILQDAAPTFAVELRRLLDLVDQLQQRGGDQWTVSVARSS